MSIIINTSGTSQWQIGANNAGFTTPYNSQGIETSFRNRATYIYARAYNPSTNADLVIGGDLLAIFGSNTKTVRVHSVQVGGTAGAATSSHMYLAKRSSIGSGHSDGPIVKVDSNDPAPTANIVLYDFGGATTPGTLVGYITNMTMAIPVSTPTSFAGIIEEASKELLPWNYKTGLPRPITLRSTQEGVAIGVANSSDVMSMYYRIVWSEE